MEVDLTNSELFKSFAEFEQEELHIDLHTEFDCVAIDFSSSKRQLTLSFKRNKYCKCEVKSVEVVFDDCTIERYCSKFDRTNIDSGTLDIMYRGRFEIGNNELGEISRVGLYYYYINFLPDVGFELFARSVKAKVNLI
jgi:hypothetical protein